MLKSITSSLPIILGLILVSSVATGCGKKTTRAELQKSRDAKSQVGQKYQISNLVPGASSSEQTLNQNGVYFVMNAGNKIALDTKAANDNWELQLQAETALRNELQNALGISMLDAGGRIIVGDAVNALNADISFLEFGIAEGL